jgi:hypothetical protein
MIRRLSTYAATTGLLAFIACTTENEVGQFRPGAGQAPAGDTDGGPGTGDGGPVVQGPGADGGTSVPPGTTLLRVIHTLQHVGSIDVCLVSGTTTVGPLFGSIGKSTGVSALANPGYLEVPSGTYEVRVMNAGLPCSQKPVVVSKQPFTLADGARSSLVFFGDSERSLGKRPLDVAMFRDDVTPDTLKRKIRFINVSPELGGAPLDLEWRLYRATSPYQVALSGAPYAGVATGSPLGTPSADGYASIFLSDTVGSSYTLLVDGTSPLPPANHFVLSENDIVIPKAKNFTVLFFGMDPSVMDSNPSFAICADEDVRTVAGGLGHCAMGAPPP